MQAAGFLKVIGGENPLDATWIHPESYDIARRVLEKIGCDVSDLAKTVPAPPKEEPKKEFAAELAEQETGDRRTGERQESEQAAEVSDQKSEVSDRESAAAEPVLSTQYSVPSAEGSAVSSELPQASSTELAETTVLTVPEAAPSPKLRPQSNPRS